MCLEGIKRRSALWVLLDDGVCVFDLEIVVFRWRISFIECDFGGL